MFPQRHTLSAAEAPDLCHTPLLAIIHFASHHCQLGTCLVPSAGLSTSRAQGPTPVLIVNALQLLTKQHLQALRKGCQVRGSLLIAWAILKAEYPIFQETNNHL